VSRAESTDEDERAVPGSRSPRSAGESARTGGARRPEHRGPGAVAVALLLLLPIVASGGDDADPKRTRLRDVTLETLADPAALARLEAKGEVFFSTGFEGEDPLDGWYNRIGEEEGRTRVVRDPARARAGSAALELTTGDADGRSQGAGVTRWFHPGHARVHFRRYIRFAPDYDQGNLHHTGGSLYAVAGDNRWAEMGKAGIRPTGADRYGAGMEPWRDWGRNPAPGAWMLYTYWMDMEIDRDGNYWGNLLQPPPERARVPPRGEWICLETMLKANTPGEPDGELAAWIDGKLYLHLVGIRWRAAGVGAEDVLPKRASLDHYVHESRRENKIWYDDVALSTGYIGPRDEPLAIIELGPGEGGTERKLVYLKLDYGLILHNAGPGRPPRPARYHLFSRRERRTLATEKIEELLAAIRLIPDGSTIDFIGKCTIGFDSPYGRDIDRERAAVTALLDEKRCRRVTTLEEDERHASFCTCERKFTILEEVRGGE